MNGAASTVLACSTHRWPNSLASADPCCWAFMPLYYWYVTFAFLCIGVIKCEKKKKK